MARFDAASIDERLSLADLLLRKARSFDARNMTRLEMAGWLKGIVLKHPGANIDTTGLIQTSVIEAVKTNNIHTSEQNAANDKGGDTSEIRAQEAQDHSHLTARIEQRHGVTVRKAAVAAALATKLGERKKDDQVAAGKTPIVFNILGDSARYANAFGARHYIGLGPVDGAVGFTMADLPENAVFTKPGVVSSGLVAGKSSSVAGYGSSITTGGYAFGAPKPGLS